MKYLLNNVVKLQNILEKRVFDLKLANDSIYPDSKIIFTGYYFYKNKVVVNLSINNYHTDEEITLSKIEMSDKQWQKYINNIIDKKEKSEKKWRKEKGYKVS